MPLPGRIFANDEERGKKDDEYRPSSSGSSSTSNLSWTKISPRMRRRRVVAVLLGCIALYFFIKNIPSDLGPVMNRPDIRTPGRAVSGMPLPDLSALSGGQTPVHDSQAPETKAGAHVHSYNGPITFFKLAASIQSTSHTMGYNNWNKNVMFAVANAQSASRLIPLACEMARWNRNNVHLVYMARDDLSIDELKTVNGVSPSCDVFWHGE